MTEPLISADRVEELVRDCLFTEAEMPGAEPPEPHVYVEGIVNPYAFHPDRLESHRGEVAAMLLALPEPFQQSTGGGWSFLNACQDRNDVQWTGLHQTMGHLFAMGMGLGLAEFQMPRDLWAVLPGGMPYIVVKDAAVGLAAAYLKETVR